ncbi:MAG: hypothetical protein Q8N74_01515 [Sulfuricella sp.]|nr:hypothetical protein [Sulfuricella sp.]
MKRIDLIASISGTQLALASWWRVATLLAEPDGKRIAAPFRFETKRKLSDPRQSRGFT